jgi:lipoprotein-anchoring transpeptidase ErfK/SrfK
MRYRFTPLLLCLCLSGPAFAAKSLLVDLSKSTVYAMQDGKVVRALVINPGGSDTPTRPGKYRITQKVRSGYRSNLVDVHNKPLKKGALGAPMDFWMRLGGTGMGFHRSSLWRPNGRWGSHGCMRMSRSGARWLHDWTPMGTPVTVVSGGTLYTSAV